MKKLVFKRLVAITLIVSMIFTMGGFVTFAESISDVVETSKNEAADSKELSHKYYDNLVGADADSAGANADTIGANADTIGADVDTVGEDAEIVGADANTVGASIASPDADSVDTNHSEHFITTTSDIDKDTEEDSEDIQDNTVYEEEPEEDVAETDSVGADANTVGASIRPSDFSERSEESASPDANTVGASIASPDANTVGASIASPDANTVGASIVSPDEDVDTTISTDSDAINKNDNESTIIEEESDIPIENDKVENSDIEKNSISTTSSILDNNDENSDNDKTNISTTSIILDDNDIIDGNDVINDNDINISTPSEETETNLNIASESSINIEDVSNEVISTTSDLTLATLSDAYSEDLLFGSIASESEISLASESEISLASLSELGLEENSKLYGAATLKIGDIVKFGNFPQSYSDTDEAIEWKVMALDNGKALLLSEYILETMDFGAHAAYRNSKIKDYLSNYFYNTAFNDYEKSVIQEVYHEDTYTTDKVFILSEKELYAVYQISLNEWTGGNIWEIIWNAVENIFSPDDLSSLRGRPTQYVLNKPRMIHANKYYDGYAAYWTRTPVDGLLLAGYVKFVDYDKGKINTSKPNRSAEYTTDIGVRPAMWVDASSIYFTGKESKLTWDLDGGEFHPGNKWKDIKTYREGVVTKLPPDSGIFRPKNKELAGWKYSDNQTAPTYEISPTTRGDITVKAIWQNAHYGIWYNLLDEGIIVNMAWRTGRWDGDSGPTTYQYGVGLALPTNVIGPPGREFDHWEMSDNGKRIRIDSISKDTNRSIDLYAVYRNKHYNINYDLVDDESRSSGFWDGDHATTYEYTVGVENLPINVKAPTGRVFDHWEINGVATTSIAKYCVGDITLKASYVDAIWLGTFPQNDKTGGQLEPIKWRVVSKNGNEALLVSDKIIYTDHFNYNAVVREHWIGSRIRNWLNGTFKNDAFTTAQKNNTIINKTLPTYVTSETSADYEENIFLLSADEAKLYFNNKDSLRARATEYAKNHAENHSITIDDSGSSPYWLRSKLGVNYQDSIDVKGYVDKFAFCDNKNTGVRPAFYLNLSSNIYKSSNNGITFNLNGGSFKKESKLWEEFTTYQGGQKLPDSSNITPPEGDTFLGWIIRGESNIINEIPVNQTGDIVLDAVYGSIWFGTYPQGDKTGVQVEPIKWKILKQEGNEVLLVSDKVLDNVSYHNTRTNVNWKDSDMRSWLDGSFKNKAFTTRQINDGIIAKTISNGTDQPQTQDKIFLLSTDEAHIFSSDKERMSKGTEYAKNINYDGMHIFDGVDGYTRYWLRTRHSWAKAFVVEEHGTISYDNYAAVNFNSKNYGVRPALYANINSDIFRLSNNRVTWDLNGGSWKEGSKLWGEMTTYQGGQKLPTAENLIAPLDQEFLGWSYYREEATISEIEPDKTGNIILVANWSDHPYNITWDLMDLTTGIKGSWVGRPGPSTYTYGVGLPSLPTNATSNNAHRVFDHFAVLDGTEISRITPKDTGNKVIVAVYRNRKYNVIWDLRDKNTVNVGTWNGKAGPSTYEYSVGITKLPTNVKGPTGREFDHWEIGGKVATSISDTADGNITIKAVYKNKIYNIHYALGEGKWKNNFNPDTTYEYGTLKTLPNGNTHIVPPTGRLFSKWQLKFDEDPALYDRDYISSQSHGNVEVMAVYKNITYNLKYQDEHGNPITWTGNVPGPATYTYQTGIPYFPTNVEAVGENEFDHWEINNLIVTGIAPTAIGDKVVVAIYKKKTYRITWHLDDILGQIGDWDGEAGKDTYTYGTEYILPTNINPPKATKFAGWTLEEDGIIVTTCISKYDTGNKDFYAIYEPVRYNITWNLNGASIDESTYYRDDWYTYQMLMIPNGRIPLPVASQITNVPVGKEFSHWAINGTRATAIEPGTMGDLTITLVFKGEVEHNIIWNYGVGNDHWEFDGWTPPATFSEGIPVLLPDTAYLFKTPNGREIDYFTVNGVKTNVIDADTDVVVAAVLKDKTYRIKYNLDGGSWDDGEEGANKYTHGDLYWLPTNIIPPRGKAFSHWEINGVATTSILPSDYGHKEFTAIYEVGKYKIYWILQSSTVNYDLPTEYTYGVEVPLPTANQITTAGGREFDYWTVNGARLTSITPDFVEVVIVSINYVSYSITWELGNGKLPYYYLPSLYEKGIGLKLPLANDLIPPTDYTFEYFTVNGKKSNEISNNQVGSVTVKAIYKHTPSPKPTPTPEPTPYYPSGGGGSSGGGGGGGGGIPIQAAIITTTYLNQIKLISQTYDENNVAWIYDPIYNKFKINISMGDEVISVVDGFCNIYKVITQTENGVETQVPSLATYCFKDGNMLTGWIKTIDDKWYFLETAKNVNEGQLVYGYKQIEGIWYYFTADGSMLVNSVTPEGMPVGADGAIIAV